MDQPVKTRRPYHSPKHEAMRQATRQSVIAAAGRLFSERGYAGSSIEALAGAAGVAVPTVYAAFGNKRSILRAMLAAAVDEAEPRPVVERIREQAAGVPDPATRVQKMIRLLVSLLAQSADVLRVIRVASNDARTRRLADVMFAFTSSDLFDLLTGQRGWSIAEYERWAIQTVTAALPT